MSRVKGGISHQKRRRNVLKYTKGFRWGRKSKLRRAREALLHAGKYAYRDRRVKKRDFRRLWQIRINAASRKEGVSYSKLAKLLKEKNIGIDRKILATLAKDYPAIFQEIVKTCQS